jgi:hypothetical protein
LKSIFQKEVGVFQSLIRSGATTVIDKNAAEP